MDSSRRLLSRHLSRLARERLADQPGAREAPLRTERLGAILLADFCEFTALTERLMRVGPKGAEQLSGILDTAFGALVEEIEAQGGDVLAFAGDAVLAYFPARSEPELAQACAGAARCGLAIQARVPALQPGSGVALECRVSVGAGTLQDFEVGGIGGRWLPLVTGEPIAQVARGYALRQVGHVVLSPEAWRPLAARAQAARLGDGFVRLDALPGASTLPGLPPQAPYREPAPEQLEAYVPPVVVERVAAGQGDLIAEFRNVNLLFAARQGTAIESLAGLQALVVVFQEEVRRFGGQVYQLVSDEKGLQLIGAFGLPMHAAEHDASRAAQAALAIASRVALEGDAPALAIATGPVFCGVYGSANRAQYSIVGSCINRAARIVQEASPGEVLCDEETHRAAEKHVIFEAKRGIRLRGISGVTRTWAATGRRSGRGREALTPLLGRTFELESLERRVAALREHRTGGAVLVEADPGMGKTTLLNHLTARAAAAGVRVLAGGADPVEQRTPWFAFRSVVTDALGLADGQDGAAQEKLVMERFGNEPDILRLAPLLADVVPLELPDNELTRALEGADRAEKVQGLMLRLLSRIAKEGPLLVALEDGHWMDAASWGLARTLCEEAPFALLVISTRPQAEPPAAYGRICATPRAEKIVLGGLPRKVTSELAQQQLGRDASEDLRERIVDMAQGNPFFSQELALSVRTQERESRARGEAAGTTLPAVLRTPATVEGVITSRIDALDPQVQLTLKVASVVGTRFEASLVARVHPTLEPGRALDDHLSALADADLIRPTPTEPDGTWLFRHALIHETTYSLLPYVERRKLHQSVASLLEVAHAREIGKVAARLAHHWDRAEDPVRALSYTVTAGEQALNAYANRDAAEYFARTLELDEAAGGASGATDRERARWQLLRGHAHYSLNEHAHARDCYHASLATIGHAIRPGSLAGAARGVVGHLVGRALPVRRRPLSGADRERALAALAALEPIMAIQRWAGETVPAVDLVFHSRQLAERAAPSGQSAATIAVAALALSAAGFHEMARRDARRALEMAEAEADPTFLLSTRVLCGLLYLTLGEPARAIDLLREAESVATAIHAGLWKHRTQFCLGEACLAHGRLPDAGLAFQQAARLSVGAEAHASGFAGSLHALCELRQGRVEDALAILASPETVERARGDPVPLSLFSSLAVLAEAWGARGEDAKALNAVKEAEGVLAWGDPCNSYPASAIGHGALAGVVLDLWERAGSATLARHGAEQLEKLAVAASRRLDRVARSFPFSRARAHLARGRLHAIRHGQGARGAAARARRELKRATDLAHEMHLPHERGAALLQLGRLAAGAERHRLLEEAAASFAAHGLVLENERVRYALESDPDV
jgi:class 3 adenylate cyclase/tetratricopeptide (TPR) repeat protein